jgi:hydrogenase maturation protein HypF
LALWDRDGNVVAERHEALLLAADAIRRGKIVAMKGLGGFHLMVDACNHEAVSLLRQRKVRPDKPFAVMYPSLLQVPFDCELSTMERDLLTSAAAPIVLLRRLTSMYVAHEVAPDNPYLGVMLPYTPLHMLLMQELHFPIVATSGNRSGEPICTDEHEALSRLGDIADVFLVHNRPIVRPVDDSVVQVAAGKIMMLRRARGYAPDPLPMPDLKSPLLAVGAHLKNTVAVAANHKATLSQHLGDLDTLETVANYDQSIDSLKQLYEVEPSAVMCDLHPDYHSSHLAADYAQTHQLPLIKVQHHYAHVCACMAEHGLKSPLLGVAWDGTGFGTDGTIWGGEFLRITPQGYERVATLRPFPLPGGEASIREPRRTALGLLFELYGDNIPDIALAQLGFSEGELARFMTMLRKGLNCPRTSSIGRLFDAVASLIGLRQKVSFEGQAAIDVEAAALSATDISAEACYPLPVTKGTGQGASVGLMIESKVMLQALLDDLAAKLVPEIIAAKFHNSLAVCISEIARQIGEPQIVLTGGCFQNRTLLARTVDRLSAEGFSVYWPNQYPPNDGGIALGQIAAAVRQQ